MKPLQFFPLVVSRCLCFSLLAVASASASVVDTFDGGGSAFQSTGAPGITAGGPTGNFFRVTDATTSQSGMLAYDTTDPGYYRTVTATFDFAMRNGGGDADGLSFALLPTSLYGNSGVPGAFISEEANFVGGVGIGFDTYNNGAVDGNSDNRITLHYNNALIASFDPLFELNSNTFNRASVTLDFAARTASLTVIENVNGAAIPHVVFTNQSVPGMTPYTSRPYFGGRTGGSFQNHDLDNVNVAFSQAVTYAESFDDGQANGGVLNGNAVANANSLRLTENLGNQLGSFNIMDLNPGKAIASFRATFDVAIGPGSATPADGVSLVFGQLADNANYGEEGPGAGLVISADTYDNGGGEAPAIDVIVNGVTIGHTLTNPFTAGAFVPVSVVFNADHTLDLTVNGTTIYSGLATGYTPAIGDRFGFGARTGGATEEARVDNISITTTVPEPASLSLLGFGLVGLLARRRR